MDGNRFDALAKLVGEPTTRRWAVRSLSGGTVGVLLSLLGLAETEADRKKRKKRRRKKKKRCPGSRQCGKNCCGNGTFCCDDARKVCCANGSECCNPGPGTGSCCSSPNRCGRPYGNDAAPSECCPPERQWFTTTGLVRCCPAGTRSLGTGISSDDGPCCPEAKYCSTSPTGGKCCPDVAPICLNQSTGQCCDEANKCGTDCCGGGRVCCNGTCCSFDQICDGGTCKCPGGREACGDECCSPAIEFCEGGTCVPNCYRTNDCGG